MFAGPIGDYLGRKVTILMGALFFLLGGALQTGARTTAYLFAGRAFAGFGVGFLVMVSDVPQSRPSVLLLILSL